MFGSLNVHSVENGEFPPVGDVEVPLLPPVRTARGEVNVPPDAGRQAVQLLENSKMVSLKGSSPQSRCMVTMYP